MWGSLIAAVAGLMVLAGTAQAQTDGGNDRQQLMPGVTMPDHAAGIITLMPPGLIAADQAIGATVISPDGQEIGTIADLLIDPRSGQVAHVVIRVGGFLGIGAKLVAVGYDQISFKPDNRIRVDMMPADFEAVSAFRYEPAGPAETGEGESEGSSQ